MRASMLLALLPLLASTAPAKGFNGKGQVRVVTDTDGTDIGYLTSDGAFAKLEDKCATFTAEGALTQTKLSTKTGACGTGTGPGNATLFACNAIFQNGGQPFLIGDYNAGATLDEFLTGKATWTNQLDHSHPTDGQAFQPMLEDRMDQQGTFLTSLGSRWRS